MTTTDYLSRAVVKSIKEARPEIENVEKLVADLGDLEFSQMTPHEQGLVRIAGALKESLPLINILTAVKAGDFGNDGFPRLALAPYRTSLNQHSLIVDVTPYGYIDFADGYDPTLYVRLSDDSFRWIVSNGTLRERSRLRGSTNVPIVPPTLRVKNPKGVFLLFEVTDWKRMVIPRDPYLLRKIAGYIYSVLGTWDISERELMAYQAARKLGI